MLNRLLYERYQSPNNGRQIVRLPDGRLAILVHSRIAGPARIWLRVSRQPSPSSMADFDTVAELAGPAAVVPEGGTSGYGASLLLAEDRLIVAWTGQEGLRVTSCALEDLRHGWAPAAQLPGPFWLGDLFLVEGLVHLTYHEVLDRQTEAVGLARTDGEHWYWQEVYRGEPLFAPVADVGPDGRLHLAWADVAERLRYAVIDPAAGSVEVSLLGDGKQPSILAAGDQVLIGCESHYPHIHYYVADRGRWSQRRSLTWGHEWFMPDLPHSPQLCRDRHGVVWLFFSDNTRKSTFWARWMGQGWSDIYNGPRVFFRPPHFDFNLLPIGRLSVEKQPPRDAEDIGLILTCEPPADRVEYRRQPVPGLRAAAGRKVLFFDLLEVGRAEGLHLVVNPATKHPANPLMQTGPDGSFDQDRVFNHGTVMRDGDRYRMWYGAVRMPRADEPLEPWWDLVRCGYAESADGLVWQRVRVGLVEWQGSLDNNLVPYLRHSPVVIRDETDPDPARRYKAFYFWNAGEMREMAKTGKYGRRYDFREERFPMDLLTSPDGLHWTVHPGEVVFPGDQVKPFSAIPQSVFRDEAEPDPQKRYKAYGFMSLNLRRRGTCYLWSPDGQHWTAHPEMPLIDPAVRGNPPAVGGPTGQVHDTVCFPYEGYYLALYQDQQDPHHMPIELAVSRDAETFYHVKPGSRIIPLGPPGAFDAEAILASMPVMGDDEIRLYYGGCTSRPVPPEQQAIYDHAETACLPGLATLRRDGFTAMELDDGQTHGVLETIAFQPDRAARRLAVNACCPAGGAIRVEIVDLAGQAVPGFAASDCQPVTGDGLNLSVSWAAGETLPEMTGPIRLRFHFQRGQASPRLYALAFRA